MSRKILLACTFLVMAVSLAEAAETSQLTADQIVAKSVTARGGLQAWRAAPTLSVQGVRTGGVQLPKRPAKQVRLPFRLELKRGRKSRLELDFRDKTAVQVYDGTNGWKLRPFLNRHEVETFTPDEMKAVALQSDLDGPLMDYAAKGTKLELEGTDKVEGNDTNRLRLTYKKGRTQHLWVDAKTFLETKIEGTPRRLDGKYHAVEIYYRDYRTVSGLMIPYVVETKVQEVKQTEKTE